MRAFDISQSVLFNLDFTIWTGKAKLDAADIPAAATHMPPQAICTAGAIKIFDTDLIKPFRNFKTRAELCLATYGLKCLGGWLVDDSNVASLESSLGDCHSDWANALGVFIQDYPQRAQTWAQSWGQWEGLIRHKQPSQQELWHRFDFTWQTFHLAEATTNAASKGNNTADLVKCIPDKALQSIIDSLGDLYINSFAKANDPSSKAYAALAKTAQRAVALGFANPDAARLAPILADLCNRRDHNLTRTVLSNLSTVRGVQTVLQTVAGYGIDSLLTPPEVIQLSPTALEAESKKQIAPSSVDNLLAQAAGLLSNTPPVSSDTGEQPLSMTVLNSLGLF